METDAQETALEWSELWDAMRPFPHCWITTTENMYWQMLECVPPRAMGGNGFLVGEANHHNAEGKAVYACFVQHSGRVEAKYMTVAEFNQLPIIR